MSENRTGGGRHDSGQTANDTSSGSGGRHSAERPDGWKAGTRTERPHAENGWFPKR